MPLTKVGDDVLSSMTKQYGAKKGKQVFYASINKKKKGSKKWHAKTPSTVDTVMAMRSKRGMMHKKM